MGLRRTLAAKPLMALYKKVMPPLSKTEKEALEAGTVWWEGELFSGRPDWAKLTSVPKAILSKEEWEFIDGPVEELCRLLNDWQITNELKDLSPEVWKFLKENKFFGIIIPKEYGGLGFSPYAHSSIVVKISSRSAVAAVTIMVPNSLGPAELLLHYGTEAQKNHYLPRLAQGLEIPCFALTEPEAGSDAAGSMRANGVVCKGIFEGREALGARLNWEKRYITLGPVATAIGLAFKLYDPEHLLSDESELGITIAIVPADAKGVTIGARHNPLNIPFQVGPVCGNDVFIPMDFIIGGEERIGQGWKMLMTCLGIGRSISLPALSTGTSKLTARVAGAYARVRRQFGISIGKFEGVKEKLAQIAINTYVSDAARSLTSQALLEGAKPSVVSAIVKYHLTEMGREVTNCGMDVLGGKGICLGPRNLLGTAYMSLPIAITVEGANILTRSLIIFGQGAVRSHPFVRHEMRALANPDKNQGLADFDKAIFGHIGFVVKNAWRAFYLGLANARFGSWPKTGNTRSMKRQYQNLDRMSAAFALASDAAMAILGGELKRKESLSARLADVLSGLYLMSAVLKHFEDSEEPFKDFCLAKCACQNLLYKIQESLDAFLTNFPIRPAAWVLKLLIFPRGKKYRLPPDKLIFRVADILLEPSDARERLTSGIYVPQDIKEPLGCLEEALRKTVAAEPIEKKIRKISISEAEARGIIGAEEAKILISAQKLRDEVTRVDAFETL